MIAEIESVINNGELSRLRQARPSGLLLLGAELVVQRVGCTLFCLGICKDHHPRQWRILIGIKTSYARAQRADLFPKKFAPRLRPSFAQLRATEPEDENANSQHQWPNP